MSPHASLSADISCAALHGSRFPLQRTPHVLHCVVCMHPRSADTCVPRQARAEAQAMARHLLGPGPVQPEDSARGTQPGDSGRGPQPDGSPRRPQLGAASSRAAELRAGSADRSRSARPLGGAAHTGSRRAADVGGLVPRGGGGAELGAGGTTGWEVEQLEVHPGLLGLSDWMALRWSSDRNEGQVRCGGAAPDLLPCRMAAVCDRCVI